MQLLAWQRSVPAAVQIVGHEGHISGGRLPAHAGVHVRMTP